MIECLVVYAFNTERGVRFARATCKFSNFPPTFEEIKRSEQEAKERYAHEKCLLLNIIPLAKDADAEKHGRWMKEADGGTRCSCCMQTVKDDTDGVKVPVDLSDMSYCPKCGARMEH